MNASPPGLRIEGLAKSFDSRWVLSGVELELARGESCVIEGPSGSGKSTLLRLVAGLEAPDRGRIEIGGTRATDGPRLLAPPHARGLGILFQSAALWPHLRVGENISFGLSGARAGIASRVAELLAAAGLAGCEQRRVDGLSGGEARRVALLRALAPRPSLLLLDEPLAHLDPASAVVVRQLIEQERSAFHSTLLVTAHVAEAFPGTDRRLQLEG